MGPSERRDPRAERDRKHQAEERHRSAHVAVSVLLENVRRAVAERDRVAQLVDRVSAYSEQPAGARGRRARVNEGGSSTEHLMRRVVWGYASMSRRSDRYT